MDNPTDLATFFRWLRDRDLLDSLDGAIDIVADLRSWADEIEHYRGRTHSARTCEACKQDEEQAL